MKPPEGAIVNAIWRCKRGHESPAGWQTDTSRLDTFRAFSITLEDDSVHNICLPCLVEDYGTERVDFQDG